MRAHYLRSEATETIEATRKISRNHALLLLGEALHGRRKANFLTNLFIILSLVAGPLFAQFSPAAVGTVPSARAAAPIYSPNANKSTGTTSSSVGSSSSAAPLTGDNSSKSIGSTTSTTSSQLSQSTQQNAQSPLLLPYSPDSPTGITTGTGTPTGIPTGIPTLPPTGTGTASISPTASSTASPSSTASSTPTTPPPPTLPPTSTVGSPTPAPTLTPIPDTDYVDQSVSQQRDALVAQVNALPPLTGTITGTLVTGDTGGRITSADNGLTLGMLPGVVDVTTTLSVQVTRRTFSQGDPRATRDGQPLAYTYELSATDVLSGQPVTHFSKDVTLIWHLDPASLRAAGVNGYPLHVYTFNEQNGTWEEILSRWDQQTNQLIATTPHFSLYTVGNGFEKVSNYIPNVNDFEVNLQSGTSSVNYPLNLPPGPGGFGPKVSLSYNSGNIDRVDASNQGTSPVGWGWSLSTSYIAATEHHFYPTASPTPGYHPWTVSIVTDDINGDLVKGTDGYWHTASESYARIQYNSGTDSWEAWGKDGSHYVFNLRAQTNDDNNSGGYVTNKWMLSTATDAKGNTINYTYRYEDAAIPPNLQPTPIIGNKTHAVYPYQITWGNTGDGNGDKLQVTFDIVSRDIYSGTGYVNDISDADRGSNIYQSYRIDRIDVSRKQPISNQFSLLRRYSFSQSYGTVLSNASDPTWGFRHLTLNTIIPYGNNGTTQLPSTTFEYFQNTTCCPAYPREDYGHLWWAHNGYGGAVGFYYDAAGGNTNSAYRRVRAKRVQDGLDNTIATPTQQPHNVAYYYDYRGDAVNSQQISAESNPPGHEPLHNPNSEFRGFAWVREQDPMGQSTDHYFSQDDANKAKEWRVQAGKAPTFTETMNGIPASNGYWTIGGTVGSYADPDNGGNNVWKLSNTLSPGSSIARTAGVSDGSDVDIRLRVMTVNSNNASQYRFDGIYKMTNAANSNDYWGVEITRKANGSNWELQPKVIWSIGGYSGSRDLSEMSTNLPHRNGSMSVDKWYRLRMHTSPDGRFWIELYRDDAGGEYIQVKSGDAADSGTIPSLVAGLTWKFSHTASWGESQYLNDYASLVDDYNETRSMYSQSDSLYNITDISAATEVTSWQAGSGNNTDSMNIRFVALSESRSAQFGNWCCQPGLTVRSTTTYSYDSYGNQTDKTEYGNVDVSGDERTTSSDFNTNTTSGYIVDKPCFTKVFNGIGRTNLVALTEYYYDGASSYSCSANSLSAGKLTKQEQHGVVSGSDDGERSATQFTYDNWGSQIEVTDPNNNTTTTQYYYYYHSPSFVYEVDYPNGTYERNNSFDFTLDVVTEHRDVNGTLTDMSYDVFGRPASTWIVGYDTSQYPTESYHFQDLGQSTVTPPFYISIDHKVDTATPTPGVAWATRWFDGRGRTVEDVQPKDGSYTIVTYNTYTVTGQLDSSTLPYQYGNTNRYTYKTPDTAKPKVTKYYDGAGRLSMTTNPDNTNVINDYSWLMYTGVQDESSHLKYTHTDFLGRMDQVKEFVDLGVYQYTYTYYTYDALDHLTNVLRGVTYPTGTVTPGPTATAVISYDGLGRKSQMIDPDMGTWQYQYDVAGNLTNQKDAIFLAQPTSTATSVTSHQIFYCYDNMNRIKTKYYGASHYVDCANNFNDGTPDVKYYYDNDLGDASTAYSYGKLRYAEVTLQGQGSANANGHGYVYDPKGRTVSEAITTTYSTRTYTTQYTYDPADRLTTLTYPDPDSTHEVLTISYNSQGMGLPNGMSSNKQAPSDNIVNLATYNERGQLATLDQGAYNDLLSTTFTYDDLTTKRGWLTRIQTTEPNNSNLSLLDLNMSYAPNGDITQVSQNNTQGPNPGPVFTNTFAYDGLDRLTSASSTQSGGGSLFPSEAYSFDTLSRMTTRTLGTATPTTYQYTDSAHVDAPTGYGTNSYSYDANGNQTGGTVLGVSQSRTFDPENRVSQIISGTYTTSFVYDANGQRLIKSVACTGICLGGGGSSTTRTLYIGNLYEETILGNGSPGLTPYISYYSLGGKLVGMRRVNQAASNGQYRIVGDHLGSTTLVVDTANPPNVVQRQYSKPYGETAWQYTAGSSLTSVGYSGQRLDSDSGLMFYNARFYDPALSYFVSADVVEPDKNDTKSRNRFAYVLNGPLRYTDETGHSPEDTDPDYYYKKCGRGSYEACQTEIAQYGIELEGKWTAQELLWVLDGIRKLMEKSGWSVGDFRRAMGVEAGKGLIFTRSEAARGDKGQSADTTFDHWRQANRVTFYGTSFVDTVQGGPAAQTAGIATVHELAHVWDNEHNNAISGEMANLTGSHDRLSVWCDVLTCHFDQVYDFKGTTTSVYGENSEKEDWAESVAAYVYAGAKGVDGSPLWRSPDATQQRLKFVEDKFRQYRR